MLLNKELFDKLAAEAAKTPRLRMHYDLRDSEEENGQRMLNCILPGTEECIHRHIETNEVVFCVYGSVIERFFDEYGNVTEEVTLIAGGEQSGIIIEKGRYHTIVPTKGMAVVITTQAGKYNPNKTQYLEHGAKN